MSILSGLGLLPVRVLPRTMSASGILKCPALPCLAMRSFRPHGFVAEKMCHHQINCSPSDVSPFGRRETFLRKNTSCGKRFACVSGRGIVTAASGVNVVEQGDYVELHYVGTLDDGSMFDASRERGTPLGFFVGEGRVVPGFEKIAMGMAVGETKKERIEPSEAYGDWREEMTATVPTAQAPEGLQTGAYVQLQNGMQAKVTEVNDENVTIDANHPLAGKALTFDVELVKLAKGSDLRRATFGAGCFWGVELNFQRVPGVLSTAVGYSQGGKNGVTYEEVCSGDTGHNEVVQIVYDPSEVSYETLIEVFFDKHDPTTLNRQGNDTGTQYRSGIYYHDEEQKKVAEEMKERMQGKFNNSIVTEIEEIKNFNRAEEYHQQYLERGGRFGQPQSAAKGCTDPVRCYG